MLGLNVREPEFHDIAQFQSAEWSLMLMGIFCYLKLAYVDRY